MKCYYHSNNDAVATCSTSCGKHLCQECASMFKPTICRDCFADERLATQKSLSSAKTKAILSICWHAFFFTLGIILAISAYIENPNGGIWGILIWCWGISGMPWVITSGILAKDKSIEAQVDRAVGRHVDPGASVVSGIMGFFLKVFLGFIIGAIASPIILIVSIIKLKSYNQDIAQAEKDLNAVTNT